jgi:hypothetical protein
MFCGYNYDAITMMCNPEEDLRYLSHHAGGTLPIVYPPQPIARRTRSQVARLTKHIKLMKHYLPELRRLQAAPRAEQSQRYVSIAAARPPSPVPVRAWTFVNRLNRGPL